MVKRFRTKVVEIEAVRWTGDNHDELYEWTGGKWQSFPTDSEGFSGLIYDFLHDTWIKVIEGQWIVCGAKGEFYPCDDETFHWKYEEVTVPDFTFTGTLEYRDGAVTSHGFDVDVPEGSPDRIEPERFEG